jgi:hypothetical protein
MYASFIRLAQEVEDRLPLFCLPSRRVADREEAVL